MLPGSVYRVRGTSNIRTQIHGWTPTFFDLASLTFQWSCELAEFFSRDVEKPEDLLVHQVLLVWTHLPQITLLTRPTLTVHLPEDGVEGEVVSD